MQLIRSMWITWQVEFRSSTSFLKKKMQVMMQSHVVVKTLVQQSEPWLYQQVLDMKESYGH